MAVIQNSSTRINYVLVVYGAKNSGVFKKIRDQFESWKSMGAEPRLFVITDIESVESWRAIDPNALILVDSGLIRKALNRIQIVKMAQQSNPNVIYLRDSFPIRVPKSRSTICLEIQSLYGREILLRSKIKYLLFKVAAKFIYRNVDAAVYVSRELMELNEARCSKRVKRIVISNGINLERIDLLPTAEKSKPALFFVGHPGQNWHGIADLIDFARVSPDFDFHLVGNEVNYNLPNVYTYGLLTYDDYRSIARKCSAGVGSLNLEVNGMSEASPLKTREYLAMGLPVITRYLDSDFTEGSEFILRIPQNGKPLEEYSREIKNFIEKWQRKRVARDQIAHLDTTEKEKTRLRFLRELGG